MVIVAPGEAVDHHADERLVVQPNESISFN
jgi:hypothetical protein